MLDYIVELLIYAFPQTTGRGVVYLITLGQVRCEEGTAKVIGILFWILVFFVTMVFLTRI
jgi:hypothetical protein